jgi:hypothetical protein
MRFCRPPLVPTPTPTPIPLAMPAGADPLSCASLGQADEISALVREAEQLKADNTALRSTLQLFPRGDASPMQRLYEKYQADLAELQLVLPHLHRDWAHRCHICAPVGYPRWWLPSGCVAGQTAPERVPRRRGEAQTVGGPHA